MGRKDEFELDDIVAVIPSSFRVVALIWKIVYIGRKSFGRLLRVLREHILSLEVVGDGRRLLAGLTEDGDPDIIEVLQGHWEVCQVIWHKLLNRPACA